MKTMKKLPKIGEVISYELQKGITTLAYVLNRINNTYYLYSQNKLVAIEVQHTVEDDPITDDLYDTYHEVNTTILCDYCIIPKADCVLKRT